MSEPRSEHAPPAERPCGGVHNTDVPEWREDLAKISEGICPPCGAPLDRGVCTCCGMTFAVRTTDNGAEVTITVPILAAEFGSNAQVQS